MMDMADVVDDIYLRHDAQAAHTFVVAVDGGGGAGKSTFADALALRLGGAPVVRTDDFATWDVPLRWAPRFLEQVLEPVARGDVVRYQRSDWQTRTLMDWIEVTPSHFLVIEGVGASQSLFVPFISYAVWIATDRDERLRRGIQRDGSAMAGEWARWMSEEDEYFERESPVNRADAVVRGDAPLPRSEPRLGTDTPLT